MAYLRAQNTVLLLVPVVALLMLQIPRPQSALVAQTVSDVPPVAVPAVGANLITYEVTPNVGALPSLLHVALGFNVPVQNGKPEEVVVQMPVWSPGDYHVQNFGKYVQNLQAADALVARDQRRLPVAHPDANTWTIQARGTSRVRIDYDLPTMPRGYFSENVELRRDYVFINGASALLYLVGHKDAPALLTAHLPVGWRAETPLPLRPNVVAGEEVRAPNEPAGNPQFDAPDYDTLADSPLVMAAKNAIRVSDLTLAKPAPNVTAHYRAVYFGDTSRVPDIDTYNQMLARIAQTETRLMSNSPNPLYEFFLEVQGRGGGLEHLNSCRLPLWPGSNVQQAAPFFAHEFFHQWNVKRIRPLVLGPFDYVHPPRTHNLWFAEGVTEYYAHVATRRAGLRTEEQFYAHWRQAIARMQRNPARLMVTADDASWKVWDSGNSEGYGGLSYYDKGELIGLCLDLKIRHITQNRKTLDHVMRALLQQYAPPHGGYGEDDLRNAINVVAGQDLTAFYNLLARSTQEMPFAECLAYAGLDADLHPLPKATQEQLTCRAQWATEWP